ncbi:LamG domain-containing protein [Candidatus Poribacteria bacterium]|nr:LamG domain-containing protein [Candidatus Poribacteria bacterium]
MDFETFGLLMPEGTDEFTFEAWIYLTTPPNRDTHPLVLSQQVRMYVWNHGHLGLRLMSATHLHRLRGVAFGMLPPFSLSVNQWHHIAFQAEGVESMLIVNDVVRISGGRTILAADLSHAKHPRDFTIGGFGEKIASDWHGGHFWGHFEGYIDEVRISTVARYNIGKRGFTPRTKFENDAETVALWHFDEPSGTREFSDTSGNAYHLMGKNGARTDGEFAAVEAEGKLATLWGRLKE